MTNDTMRCETYVEQVQNGIEYKGHMDLDGVKFTYTMKFGVHIDRLDDLAGGDPQEVLKQIGLEVRDPEGNPVSLEDEQAKGLFYGTLLPFVVDFYNNPQTRDSNEGFFGQLLEGRGPFTAIGASASIGISRSGSFKRSPELEKIVDAYRG